ncbi:MAG: vitamin K epoxide reductase family protein [Ktedonobacterales bacterium]
MSDWYAQGVNSVNSVGRRVGAVARQQPLLVAIVACAVVGFGISVYLTAIHYEHVAPVCTVTGIINCANVLKSRYSTVPGTSLPITLPGMFWFLVSGALAIVGLASAWRDQDEPQHLRLYQLLWGAAGMLFVLYLVYAELVQLHNICEWCTGVHILTLITFILAWYRFAESGGLGAGTSYPSQKPPAGRNQKAGGVYSSRMSRSYALPRSARTRASGSRRSANTRSLRD